MPLFRSHPHQSRLGALALLAAILPAVSCITLPEWSTNPQPEPSSSPEPVPPVAAAQTPFNPTFQIWDMHASGTDPDRSQKVISPELAARGYWLSSAYLAMPRLDGNSRNGVARTLSKADLAQQAEKLRQRLERSSIDHTDAMVMLDAEAFQPYESEKALEWYNQTARVASEKLHNWFWYFQPFRARSIPPQFHSEQEYYDWYAQQDFIKLASAISVTVYHGRIKDANSPVAASARVRNDPSLKQAILFARRVGKPLIVVVRADIATKKPRQQLMSPEALEASWRELFLQPGVDGIAIWNGQNPDNADFDRNWARTRIEPAIRKLLTEREQWLHEKAPQLKTPG